MHSKSFNFKFQNLEQNTNPTTKIDCRCRGSCSLKGNCQAQNNAYKSTVATHENHKKYYGTA